MSPHPLTHAAKVRLRALGLAAVEHHEPSLWLRDAMDGVLQRVRDRQMEPCAHVSYQGPLAVVLWAPTRLLCGDCLSTVRPVGVEDKRCDRCSSIVDTIHPCLNVVGLLVVCYGLCRSCRDREVC